MKILKLGITGGIGSGKSYLCAKLAQKGIPVYDTDREAKRIMHTVPQVRCNLEKLVGENLFRPDGSMDKKIMSDFLFSSSENASQIASIVHPAVADDFLEFSRKCAEKHSWCILESAILIESGFYKLVDRTLCVVADEEIRVQRTMLRDGVEKEEVYRRIRRQISDEIRLQYPFDYIINNNCDADFERGLAALMSEFELF